jgi:hypothetical protein
MKKNSSLWYGMAARTLAVVIVSGLLCSFLIIPAAAMSQPAKEDRALWDKIIKDDAKANAYNDRILLPQPPYITNNPTNPGSYYGPCPIGTGGAPQLRQTGLSSGAECRGACGMDCPDERCKPLGDWPIKIEGGTCTYKNMIGCPSHQGCIDHDACYDYCSEKSGDSSVLFGHCHGLCNQRCYDEYGIVACAKWAALPGAVNTKVGRFLDYYTNPSMDVSLTFSDEPVFTPDPPKTGTSGSQPCDSINPYDCWTMKDR